MNKIHHTRGVYPNGDFRDNAVSAEDLEGHIQYNKFWRFGRALFVDGVLVYAGHVSKEILDKHTGVVNTYTKASDRYH
jgi:hypothetical protein